jgi:hypothetical protein
MIHVLCSTRLGAELTATASRAIAGRVTELASQHQTITHTMARASRFKTRASLTFTPIEVSDVH